LDLTDESYEVKDARQSANCALALVQLGLISNSASSSSNSHRLASKFLQAFGSVTVSEQEGIV